MAYFVNLQLIITRKMEIRHLRLIKAIVEEGSITKAIDKLHLTQSALSHQHGERGFRKTV